MMPMQMSEGPVTVPAAENLRRERIPWKSANAPKEDK